jgi:hypothetical protein
MDTSVSEKSAASIFRGRSFTQKLRSQQLLFNTLPNYTASRENHKIERFVTAMINSSDETVFPLVRIYRCKKSVL